MRNEVTTRLAADLAALRTSDRRAIIGALSSEERRRLSELLDEATPVRNPPGESDGYGRFSSWLALRLREQEASSPNAQWKMTIATKQALQVAAQEILASERSGAPRRMSLLGQIARALVPAVVKS